MKYGSLREVLLARMRSYVPVDVTGEELEAPFLEEIRAFFNVSKVRKMFRLGTELFDAAQAYIERPTVWNGAKALFGMGKVFVDDVEIYSDSYFDGDEWTRPYSRDFNQTILEVLAPYPYQTLKTSEENDLVRIVDLEGPKAGWIYNTKLRTVDHIYVETDRADEARQFIKKLLWNKFKDKPVVMRHNRKMIIGVDEPKVVFEIDDAFNPLPSKRASEYAVYLKRCLDAGVPRSVMLYGPPGTGKSTMARTLVENLKLRSFRIRVEDVSGLENSTLFEAINIFEPDAIILDDFDRAHGQASLLETLEFFQHHVKLVVATVNNKNDLDEALLRPGRFDELVLVNKMDDAVIKHVLGEYADGFDDVKEWPIAFIQEYVKRRRFMSPEEATASTEELARRVKRLDKYCDEDDMEQMWRLLQEREEADDDDIDEALDEGQPAAQPASFRPPTPAVKKLIKLLRSDSPTAKAFKASRKARRRRPRKRR